MSQESGQEPEFPTGKSSRSTEAKSVRTMAIQEHAALVQAIMLNFPEIYEEPAGADLASQPGESDTSNGPLRGSASA